jgi:hypothetical protein
MSKNLIFLLILVMMTLPIKMRAQISCSNLSLAGGYQDSIQQNSYWFSVQYQADANNLINYPYISTVLNCEGDTLATGSMFYFGQLGQTTQDYPVSTNNALWCVPLSIEFIYGNELMVNDTCYFTFETANLNSLSSNKTSFVIVPNPVHNYLQILTNETYLNQPFEVYSIDGTLATRGSVESTFMNLSLASFKAGMYFFYFPWSSERKPFVKF